MGKRLTRRQREVLDYIQQYTRSRGYSPSVREIGRALGISSSSTVHSHLSALQSKGYIHRDYAHPRAIQVLRDEESMPVKRVVPVPVVGRVAAGEPLLAVENIEDVFPLPWDFVRDEEAFLLRVRGDSMIGAGIHDGDLLLVRRQQTAKNGDIVVALLGEEATVKRFYKEGEWIRLKPENPAMEPVIVRDAVVLGKAIALIRRLD